MLDGLFEYSLAVYLVLAVAAVVLLALWFRVRRRGWLYGLGVVALLLGVFFLLDLTVETPQKQIKRNLQQMAQAVSRKDTNALFDHVSEQFAWEGMNKEQFRLAVDALLKNGIVTDLVIWDEKFPDASGRVAFTAKPKGPNLTDFSARIKATFVREGKRWRLKSFTVHNLVNGEPIPITLPHP